MMSASNLLDRKNFLANYLKPAIADGWIVPLYPESPRHPPLMLIPKKHMELTKTFDNDLTVVYIYP